MLVLTGPARSGKTFAVLARFREAIQDRQSGIRLLVPSATLEQHLHNQLAREGCLLRPGLILTLSRFIEPWVADTPQVTDVRFPLLVEEIGGNLNRQEFARVVNMPGFWSSLAQTLEEFSAAGCSSEWLAQHLPAAPLAEAFLAVFQEVERELTRRHLAMRATRLQLAASRIEAQGLGELRSILLDGFSSFTDPELTLLIAVSRFADVTVTLPTGPVSESSRRKLLGMGFEERACERERSTPETVVFKAGTIEKEANEIARRILEQVAAGSGFREIGIIVRNPDRYVPVLRATLERFGIPARFYFHSALLEHAVGQFLCGVVDAMLGGWDHAETLAVMKLAATNQHMLAALDRLDFQVRRHLPGKGLEGLDHLAQPDGRVAGLVKDLNSIDSWRSGKLAPAVWAERVKTLRNLFRAPRPSDTATYEQVAIWRNQASALDVFEAAMDEAAQCFQSASVISLADFWKTAKSVIRLMPLRAHDGRRNVVHVLSAKEARQWELAVVFVCGLADGEFPRHRTQNAFFSDSARKQLIEDGLAVRMAVDEEQEEQFLFESAVTRATRSLMLSYPLTDARGEQNLPSHFLERVTAEITECKNVRPQSPPVRSGWKPGSALRSPDLLKIVADRHSSMKPTPLESFLQCPFQFFAGHTLRLEPAPPEPEERLDFSVQGKIVHAVLAQWLPDGEPIENVFERVFRAECEKANIPIGFRTEALRQEMLANLRRFAGQRLWNAGWENAREQDFRLQLQDGTEVVGRIDSVTKRPDGRGVVIDYKYSRDVRKLQKKATAVQGPLYLLAVEQQFGLAPAAMLYCSLKGGVEYAGWGEPIEGIDCVPEEFTRAWLDEAVEKVLSAAAQIRGGRIAPEPVDTEPCRRYCDFRDACRIDLATEALAADDA